jgi:hypothetical protein
MSSTRSTVEIIKLREAFGGFQRGEVIRATNLDDYPAFRQCGDRLPDNAPWDKPFDGTDHARVVALENRPPPTPRPLIRHDNLLKQCGWDDETYQLARVRGFPGPVSGVYERSLWGGHARVALYSPDEINFWLRDLRRLAATAPESI